MRLLGRFYRNLPVPYWAQRLAIRCIAPAFRVGVVGVVFNESGQVLLLEHVFHKAIPWGLPGGWLQKGENPQEALAREIHEETGLSIEVGRMLALEPSEEPSWLQISYVCRAGCATLPNLTDEILSATWCSVGRLPDRLLPFHRASIAAALNAMAAKSGRSSDDDK